jgi:ABC-type nitrate/sulfonate/bicarbonate transport system substrate-binding protein
VIELITRSHGIHESALHELCVQVGLYRAAGVEVELVDGTGAAWRTASASPTAATVAVGGVVADWLRGDKTWNIHFIATAKPMMWLIGTPSSTTVENRVLGLIGRRIATPDRNHMPSLFLRLLLERHGLDATTDVEFVEVRDRPDRLRLLESGDVDASLLGPEGLALTGDRFHTLLYVGDHVEFPTVGFAARAGVDPADASRVKAAMLAGLDRMGTDEDAALLAMQAVEPDLPPDVARRVVADVIRPDWTGPAWSASGSLGEVAALAALIGIAPPPEDQLQSFLHAWTTSAGSHALEGTS